MISGSLRILTFMIAGVASAAAQDLSVTVQSMRGAITPADPFILRVTFNNTSTMTFRLPDDVTPASSMRWHIRLQDVNSGSTFTGVSTLPMGAAPEAGEINPVALQPAENKTVLISMANYAFVPGDMGFQEARNIWFPQRTTGKSFQVPAGSYRLRLGIRFNSYPARPNLPASIVEAQAAIDRDPVPLWKGQEAMTDEVLIEIRNDARLTATEFVAIARQRSSDVLGTLKNLRADSSFVSPSVHSGLWSDLSTVETLCSGLETADPADADALLAQLRKLNNAISQAVTRALEISRRPNEPVDAQVKAREFARRLRGLNFPI